MSLILEGDASTTRGDFYFGDNFSFNDTLFQDVRTFPTPSACDLFSLHHVGL
jgi:hypothetical protein